MRITPIDIQQQHFKSKMIGGYDQEEVDRFLEQVAEELETLTVDSQQLRDELSRTRLALEDLQSREATLKETLLTTQRMTDDLKSNARREAELMVANAQLRCEQLLLQAEERRQKMVTEIQALRREKVAFETNLRMAIESHLRLLDVGFDASYQEAPKSASLTTAPDRAADSDDLFP
ncbi:MAG: DivIVA domain-containing protein [Desulfuromonadales bacterium]|nr:DivIVA domain-containing protein [Desulfuromonadales bacterium]